MPVARLVAPGPSVARQTPDLAGEAPVGFGHEGGALLVPGGDKGDLRGALEGLVYVERLLARYAEDVLDALVFEAGGRTGRPR